MAKNEGIQYEMQLLDRQIKSKESLLSTLKANKYKLIVKTMARLEKEICVLKGKRDILFRMQQRGHK